jgi:hypothetical protein
MAIMTINLCIVEHWLQFASGGFAALAAFMWFWASTIKAPTKFTEQEMQARYGAPIPAIAHIIRLATRQSRLNAFAALFAGVAAICQIPQAFMPTCWS